MNFLEWLAYRDDFHIKLSKFKVGDKIYRSSMVSSYETIYSLFGYEYRPKYKTYAFTEHTTVYTIKMIDKLNGIYYCTYNGSNGDYKIYFLDDFMWSKSPFQKWVINYVSR